MKRNGLLLGVAVLLLPLGGCTTLNSLSSPEAQGAPAKPEATAAKNSAAVPTDLASAILSAQTARKSGDPTAATKILSQLVLIAPDDARVLGEYGKALAALGRSDDALAFLERAMQVDPNDWSLFSAEGVALDQKGNYPAAQSYYDRALQMKPGESSVLNNAALSHMQSGDLDGAENLLRQVMPGSPDYPRVAQNLALVQSLKAAQPAKALASATPAVAPAPAPVVAPVQAAPVQNIAPVSAPVKVEIVAEQAPPPAAPPAPSAVKTEARNVDALKSDPTVRMQTVPKDVASGPAPHDLPAKPEAVAAKAPEAKAVETAPAAKPAKAPATAPKLATNPAPAPKLITAAARTPATSSAYYVQAGSFPTEARAGQAASALDSMGARVMPGTVEGHAVYRVRIGPFLNIRQANAAVEQAHTLGHADLVIVTE